MTAPKQERTCFSKLLLIAHWNYLILAARMAVIHTALIRQTLEARYAAEYS